jgi:hypothetical protein
MFDHMIDEDFPYEFGVEVTFANRGVWRACVADKATADAVYDRWGTVCSTMPDALTMTQIDEGYIHRTFTFN